MRIVKALSVIGLAAFLVLQGLFFIAASSSPALEAAIGLIGLATGALIFISLSHWIEHKKD